MKSRKMLVTASFVSLMMLSGCDTMRFLRVAPTCQIAPPDSNLTQPCPAEFAPPLQDGTAGSVTLTHQSARTTYDACRTAKDDLAKYIKEQVDRCNALKAKK